jgi:hypothetical protein
MKNLIHVTTNQNRADVDNDKSMPPISVIQANLHIYALIVHILLMAAKSLGFYIHTTDIVLSYSLTRKENV